MSDPAVQQAAQEWRRCSPQDRVRLGPGTIDRCAEALDVLVARLDAMGYPVDRMVEPCAGVDDLLAELSEVLPAVPPALVEVWRRIGGISLVDLGRYRHLAFWEEHVGPEARTHACDGVVVEGACDDEGWVGYLLDHLEGVLEAGEPPTLPIAPDHLHKDDTSGGDPYELAVDGEDPWMAPLQGFAWVGPVRPASAPPGDQPDLVSYLRTALLECGGFPGLHGTAGYEPIRRALVAGLPVF